MILKHTLVAVLFSTGANAKRKTGRRHFKRHQAYLANSNQSVKNIPLYNFPGDADLYQSLINKEVETNDLLNGINEEFEEEQKMMSLTVGDRGHRPGAHDAFGEPWPISGDLPIPEGLSIIENAGGLSFCQEFYKIKPENMIAFCDWHLSPSAVCSMVKSQCDQLNSLMKRRRLACTKTLLEIFNPRRKWRLKPDHKARMKYCRKIVKLRNPYTWCKKKCPENQRGDVCRQKKNQCTCKLDKWLANNQALVSGDRSGVRCNPLPAGVTEMPAENHPLNDVLRCGERVCDLIPGSELPWCVGASERSGTFAEVSGNQQFAPSTSDSGSC